jgi:hypothetical protein
MLPGFTAERVIIVRERIPNQWSSGAGQIGSQQAAAIPALYGNWCGPGASGPGAPIDDLDACCMAHDQCYDREGYLDCDCDRVLCACAANTSWGSALKNTTRVGIIGYMCGPHLCNPF